MKGTELALRPYTRLGYALHRGSDIRTLAEITDWSDADLLKIRNFGVALLRMARQVANDPDSREAQHVFEVLESSRVRLAKPVPVLGLTDRQRLALALRLEDGLTFSVIGQRFNISRERVRQIVAEGRRRVIRLRYRTDLNGSALEDRQRFWPLIERSAS